MIPELRFCVTIKSPLCQSGSVSPTPQLGRGRTRHARGLCARLTPRAAGVPPAPPLPGPGPQGQRTRGPRAALHYSAGGPPPRWGVRRACRPRAPSARGLVRRVGPAQPARLRLRMPRASLVPPAGGGINAALGRGCGMICSVATCPRTHPGRHAAPVRLRPPPLVALAVVTRPMVAHRPYGLARLRCACAPGGRSGRLPCGTPPGAAWPLVTSHALRLQHHAPVLPSPQGIRSGQRVKGPRSAPYRPLTRRPARVTGRQGEDGPA